METTCYCKNHLQAGHLNQDFSLLSACAGYVFDSCNKSFDVVLHLYCWQCDHNVKCYQDINKCPVHSLTTLEIIRKFVAKKRHNGR